MDAYWIIPAFVVIDTLMERLGHRSDVRAQVPDSEILTIAVVAAKYVGDQRLALQSSSASARRLDGLDSGRVGGGVHHGRRVHYR